MSEDLKTLKKKVNQALSKKDFDSAKEYLNEILAITPEDDVAWNNRGIVLSKLGKPKNAVLSFDKAIEINPKVPQVWYGKGSVLMQLEKYRYALGCFYKVLDLDPANKKAEEKFVESLALLRGGEPQKPEVKKEEKKKPEPVKEEEKEEEPAEAPKEDEEYTLPDIEPDEDEEEEKGEEKDLEELPEMESVEEGPADEIEDLDVTPVDDEEEEEVEKKEEEEKTKAGVAWEEDDEEEEKPPEEEEKKKEEEPPKKIKKIKCKCGTMIEVDISVKPAPFKCEGCGRTGTIGKKKK